jgi:hypothetical protein
MINISALNYVGSRGELVKCAGRRRPPRRTGGDQETMSTAARVLTLNCRNENAMELFPSRRWNRRRPYLIEFIKDCAPSVIGVQECTNNMAAEITEGLGPNWTFWGSGTAKIIWNSTKWVALDQFQAGLPYTVLGITKQRPITMLKCSRSRLANSRGLSTRT